MKQLASEAKAEAGLKRFAKFIMPYAGDQSRVVCEQGVGVLSDV